MRHARPRPRAPRIEERDLVIDLQPRWTTGPALGEAIGRSSIAVERTNGSCPESPISARHRPHDQPRPGRIGRDPWPAARPAASPSSRSLRVARPRRSTCRPSPVGTPTGESPASAGASAPCRRRRLRRVGRLDVNGTGQGRGPPPPLPSAPLASAGPRHQPSPGQRAGPPPRLGTGDAEDHREAWNRTNNEPRVMRAATYHARAPCPAQRPASGPVRCSDRPALPPGRITFASTSTGGRPVRGAWPVISRATRRCRSAAARCASAARRRVRPVLWTCPSGHIHIDISPWNMSAYRYLSRAPRPRLPRYFAPRAAPRPPRRSRSNPAPAACRSACACPARVAASASPRAACRRARAARARPRPAGPGSSGSACVSSGSASSAKPRAQQHAPAQRLHRGDLRLGGPPGAARQDAPRPRSASPAQQQRLDQLGARQSRCPGGRRRGPARAAPAPAAARSAPRRSGPARPAPRTMPARTSAIVAAGRRARRSASSASARCDSWPASSHAPSARPASWPGCRASGASFTWRGPYSVSSIARRPPQQPRRALELADLRPAPSPGCCGAIATPRWSLPNCASRIASEPLEVADRRRRQVAAQELDAAHVAEHQRDLGVVGHHPRPRRSPARGRSPRPASSWRPSAARTTARLL